MKSVLLTAAFSLGLCAVTPDANAAASDYRPSQWIGGAGSGAVTTAAAGTAAAGVAAKAAGFYTLTH